MSGEKLIEFQSGLLWRIDKEGEVLIGVTLSAIDVAGSIGGIDLAEPGDEFEDGDWIGELRGKDSVIEITAPCALKIIERNEDIIDQPASLEDDPTGDAWLLRIERL